jgi:hypothetical protein
MASVTRTIDYTRYYGYRRSERRTEWSPWGNMWGAPRRCAEWLVRGVLGDRVTILAHSEKAGTARVDVCLE